MLQEPQQSAQMCTEGASSRNRLTSGGQTLVTSDLAKRHSLTDGASGVLLAGIEFLFI